jgi:Ca-activated chloride channel family protein
MTYATPEAFLLLIFLPLLVDWRAILPRRRAADPARTGYAFSSPLPAAELSSFASSSFRVRFGSPLVSLFRSIAFVLLVFALARPQTGSTERDLEAEARDIFFALDISGSMRALDFFIDGDRSDRLRALKFVLTKFIAARKGDRLGLVVFGDRVFTQCPLTLDHSVVTELVEALEVGMAGQGTAIGDGLGIAIKRLDEIPSPSKAIVLVTDGKNNSGSLLPLDAAQIAKEKGIKIYAIGIGGPEPAPFPQKNVFGMTVVTKLPMEYDEKTLTEIAAITGAKYFNAKDTEKLEEVYAEIDRLERRTDRGLEFVDYEEEYLPALLWGIGLMVLTELLASLWYVRIP